MAIIPFTVGTNRPPRPSSPCHSAEVIEIRQRPKSHQQLPLSLAAKARLLARTLPTAAGFVEAVIDRLLSKIHADDEETIVANDVERVFMKLEAIRGRDPHYAAAVDDLLSDKLALLSRAGQN